jgi:hypothetical protein
MPHDHIGRSYKKYKLSGRTKNSRFATATQGLNEADVGIMQTSCMFSSEWRKPTGEGADWDMRGRMCSPKGGKDSVGETPTDAVETTAVPEKSRMIGAFRAVCSFVFERRGAGFKLAARVC